MPIVCASKELKRILEDRVGASEGHIEKAELLLSRLHADLLAQ